MNAKEYLSQYREAEKRLEDLEEEIYVANVKMQGLSGIDYSKEPVASGGSARSPQEKGFTKVNDLKDKMQVQIFQLQILRLEIVKNIYSMQNVTYAKLLKSRYINGQNFNDIAQKMGYSYDWIKHLHKEALEEFETQHHKTLFNDL